MSENRKILVPFDFSTHSTEAVEYAARLAAQLGASIRLLTVYDPPDLIAGIVPGTSVGEEEVTARSVAARELARIEQVARAAGAANVDTAISAGAPVDEILRQAEQGRFDLIVMGTHARRGLERLLLGSVTEEVMRRASIPVLAIHLPATEAK